jgi:hypothetical protein
VTRPGTAADAAGLAAILWVPGDNPRARRFYELAGWSADGTDREIRIFGFDISEVRSAKRL